ncbi:YSIRK-type signal peptide-containing protein, partial [Staphylococcus haemolyticus]|uniref:YSIRK-type signal peptide-containing protein n=1 Tax=Staphylococcus haemolyticus TaxID=1283 RepID=UPI002902C91C
MTNRERRISKKLDFLPNRANRYSIRKFTVGTASILVGTFLYFGVQNVNNDVQAAEDSTTSQQGTAEDESEDSASENSGNTDVSNSEENNTASSTTESTTQKDDSKEQALSALKEKQEQAKKKLHNMMNLSDSQRLEFIEDIEQVNSESEIDPILINAQAAEYKAIQEAEDEAEQEADQSSDEETKKDSDDEMKQYSDNKNEQQDTESVQEENANTEEKTTKEKATDENKSKDDKSDEYASEDKSNKDNKSEDTTKEANKSSKYDKNNSKDSTEDKEASTATNTDDKQTNKKNNETSTEQSTKEDDKSIEKESKQATEEKFTEKDKKEDKEQQKAVEKHVDKNNDIGKDTKKLVDELVDAPTTKKDSTAKHYEETLDKADAGQKEMLVNAMLNSNLDSEQVAAAKENLDIDYKKASSKEILDAVTAEALKQAQEQRDLYQPAATTNAERTTRQRTALRSADTTTSRLAIQTLAVTPPANNTDYKDLVSISQVNNNGNLSTKDFNITLDQVNVTYLPNGQIKSTFPATIPKGINLGFNAKTRLDIKFSDSMKKNIASVKNFGEDMVYDSTTGTYYIEKDKGISLSADANSLYVEVVLDAKNFEPTDQIELRYYRGVNFGLTAIDKSAVIKFDRLSAFLNEQKALNDQIQQFDTATDAEKQKMLDTVNKANTDATLTVATNTVMTTGKDIGKSNIDGLTDLSSTDKATFKTRIDSAKTLEEIDTIVNEAKDSNVTSGLTKAKTTANSQIDALKNLTPEEKTNFKNQINGATSVNQIQPIVDNATKQAQTNASDKKAASLEALKAAQTQGNAVNEGDYTPNSYAPLKDALTAAQNIIDNPEDHTQAEIDEATTAIQDALDQLSERADKAELDAAISDAEGLDLDETDAEDKAVIDALVTAKEVSENGNATAEEVKTATDALNAAIKAKETQDASDKKAASLEALKAAQTQGNAVNEGDYTPNSYAPLK